MVRNVLPRLEILVVYDTMSELVVIATIQGVLDVGTQCVTESFDDGSLVLENVVFYCE